jgi:malate dehydrogenase (oxaloacetate-decarboxylating)
MPNIGISFTLIMRLEMPNSPGAFNQLAAAIGDAGGVISAVDMRSVTKSQVVRDVTVNVSSDVIGKAVREAVEALEGVRRSALRTARS